MKYNRFKYAEAVYGATFGFANYVAPTAVDTDFTAVAEVNTNWDIALLHFYGHKAASTDRATYGEHIRYGGIVKVDYKAIQNTDFSTDY